MKENWEKLRRQVGPGPSLPLAWGVGPSQPQEQGLPQSHSRVTPPATLAKGAAHLRGTARLPRDRGGAAPAGLPTQEVHQVAGPQHGPRIRRKCRQEHGWDLHVGVQAHEARRDVHRGDVVGVSLERYGHAHNTAM